MWFKLYLFSLGIVYLWPDGPGRVESPQATQDLVWEPLYHFPVRSLSTAKKISTMFSIQGIISDKYAIHNNLEE